MCERGSQEPAQRQTQHGDRAAAGPGPRSTVAPGCVRARGKHFIGRASKESLLEAKAGLGGCLHGGALQRALLKEPSSIVHKVVSVPGMVCLATESCMCCTVSFLLCLGQAAAGFSSAFQRASGYKQLLQHLFINERTVVACE